MKTKTAVVLSVVAGGLYLFFCWMGGYNFDARGPSQGFATAIGIIFTGAPWVVYSIQKNS
jgi:hypothetical protein